jgi:autotransporter family porin
MTENRPANLSANNYQPSSTELSAFHNNETDKNGFLPSQLNPYAAYVTGGFTGTTDEIIQWGAAKWGIPPDWLRAEYLQESYWNMSQLGDLTTVTDVTKYPAYSRYSSTQVYQSLGISQVKWDHPDVNRAGVGAEPLRWKSTAFNVDYQLSMIRFYFDNPKRTRSSWGDAYRSCNNWLSLAAWFQPYPWNNSGQQTYVTKIQTLLTSKTWQKLSFTPAIRTDNTNLISRP